MPSIHASLECLARKLGSGRAQDVAITAFRGDQDWQVGDPAAVYEIGSVTKAVVGTLLAVLTNRGEVGVDEPVRALLPDAAVDASVTLAHLAAHTSGLPALPRNFIAHVRDRSNPYAHYDLDALKEAIRQERPRCVPGQRHTYSNFGFAVLAHALTERTGRSLDALLRTEVLDPLGLHDTVLAPNDSQRARQVQGHTWLGRETPPWTLNAFAGAGALLSTSADMARFLRAQTDPTHPMQPAFERARQPIWRGRSHAMGLGWFLELGATELVGHIGSTAGCHSLAGFAPAHRTGLAVLVNRGLSPWGALVSDALERKGRRVLLEIVGA